jgi:hypothetical protein
MLRSERNRKRGIRMRLIDADSLKKFLTKLYEAGAPYDGIIELLDKQPTAYDVDKVVKELEELPQCSTWNHNSNNIDRIKAINIVKAGGTND